MSDEVAALWECRCGIVTVRRPCWEDGVPEHVGCGELTYIKDVPTR